MTIFNNRKDGKKPRLITIKKLLYNELRMEEYEAKVNQNEEHFCIRPHQVDCSSYGFFCKKILRQTPKKIKIKSGFQTLTVNVFRVKSEVNKYWKGPYIESGPY